MRLILERLVQALVEDQSIANGNGGGPPDFGSLNHLPSGNGLHSPNKALFRSLNLGNLSVLERRIRRELEEQGLIDPSGGEGEEDDDDNDDVDEDNDKDEVTAELSQREKELRGIMEANKLRLTSLKVSLVSNV